MDHQQPPPADLPAPPPPRRGKGIAIAAGIVAALAVTGGVGAFLLLRGSGEQLLDKLPADTDMVITVYLDPSASQKVNLLRMADEIPAFGSADEIGGQIEGAIDEALSAAGLTRDDLEWIGSQIAISLKLPETGSPDDVEVTGLIAADDQEAASATLTKLRERDPPSGGWRQEDHGGVQVWVGGEGSEQAVVALVDGVVVLSNSITSVDEVIAASRGEVDTLEGSTSFQEATADLPEGRLALLYMNPSELSAALERLQPTGLDPSLTAGTQDLDGITGMAMSVSAEEDGLAMDAQLTFDLEALSADLRGTLTAPAHENPLVEGVPADAFMVATQAGLQATFEDLADQLGQVSPEFASSIDVGFLESVTGDLAVAAMPAGADDFPSGVVMIGTTDEAAMEASISSLVDVSGIPKKRWSTTDHAGVEVTTVVERSNVTPIAFSYAVFDGAAVLGASPDAVFEVIDTLGSGPPVTESTTYVDAMALVPDGQSSLYVDIDGLADAIRGQLPSEQAAEFDASVGETMESLDAFVMGTESSGSTAHVRMVLRVG